MWSIGAVISEDSKNRLDKSLSECFSPDSLKSPINHFALSFLNKPEGEWISWTSIMPDFEFPDNTSFAEIFVPTKETYCYSSILEVFIEKLDPVFLTAPTGTGKTSIIAEIMLFSEGFSSAK